MENKRGRKKTEILQKNIHLTHLKSSFIVLYILFKTSFTLSTV